MTLKPVDENRDKTQQRGEINVPEIQKKKKHLEIKYHCERKEQTAARWIKKRKNKSQTVAELYNNILHLKVIHLNEFSKRDLATTV